ncbi:lycopene cyclase domain-containing protein [Prolixibacteraceae bacterium Z1-6]|uniref:Lycopene cyclase domain-containing protein n=1 Tax=Draconibacterium aestuarii TaxID=2998507 RepID=A0A9X3FDK7_9BACT|nr:lycopene cyclase domain-containing protein [Prolixibacteraceae bacterium Z1-6]
MDIKNLTYLLLLLVYLVIPALLSMQKKVRFVIRLKYILPASIFTGAIFVMWDMRFTELGIWSFNVNYLTEINMFKVPIEEWLSFLIIPLSSVYIYEWLKTRFDKFEQPNIFVAVSLVIFVISAILAYIFRKNMFTFFTFFLISIYLGYTIFRNRFKKHYTKFYLAFGISLMPFIIVSATLNALPVIIYNTDHVMGAAILGIPAEKFAYLFMLLLINITIYEYLNERQHY